MSQNISNDVNKQYYIKAMRRCYYICSDEAHANDIYRMRWEINKLRIQSVHGFKAPFSLFSDPKKYYIMGIDQSLDIVNSIITRFCEGYKHPDDVFVRNILGR